MAPPEAGEAIRARIAGASSPPITLTVADASAKTGLALRDADTGLKWLSTEFRGQLRVTAGGDLVHVFPAGFSKPWEGREARSRFFKTVGRVFVGALRFIVRAWVTIVLVGYAAIFIALVVAMAFARQGGDSNSRRGNDLPGGELAYAFFRVVGDALFWTFHPWSPFSVGMMPAGYGTAQGVRRARSGAPRVPFYERVNRFFFGPSAPPEDPLRSERLIVAAIRAGKGRIGLADVMRVTGLPREQADPLMAKLMLDYEGDVAVSDEGGIFYRFPALRKTASDSAVLPPDPPAAWTRAPALAPITGNPVAANLGVAALNAFNLWMGAWAIENGLTLERAAHLFDRVPHPIVDTGTPIVLGVIPLAFSALLFMLPLARMAVRPWKRRAVERENARLSVLREVLERVRSKQPVTEPAVAEAWRRATGRPPQPKELDRELVSLGGDVALESGGGTRWRFAELETEAAAVKAEREAAEDEEARLGEIVYATDEH